MQVEIEYKHVVLYCEIYFKDLTFEQTWLNEEKEFEVESIRVEDSKIDILDLLYNDLETIKQIIYENL